MVWLRRRKRLTLMTASPIILGSLFGLILSMALQNGEAPALAVLSALIDAALVGGVTILVVKFVGVKD
jgi:hypothetical protein